MKHCLLPLFVCLVVLSSCSNDDQTNDFNELNQIALDATNNRLFLSQTPQEMFVLTATTGENDVNDNEPFVTENNDATTHALLPTAVSQMGVYALGSASRLFIMGGFDDGNGTTVFNRIRVLDFDGSVFTEATGFSPIILSDGDDATDETVNSFASLLIDQTNGYVFITDTSAGLLYVLSAADGTQVVAPIAIAGAPQGLSLDNNYVYVCNTSATVDEQVVTVVNIADYSTTQIDLDAPCDQIAVKSFSGGTVMIVRRSDEAQVFIRTVDTTTYATSTAIVSSSSDYSDGFLTDGAGISSNIADVVLIQGTDGLLYGYLSELDGNIEFLTFALDASTYSISTVSTLVSSITYGQAYEGQDLVYFISETGSLLSITTGSDDVNTSY